MRRMSSAPAPRRAGSETPSPASQGQIPSPDKPSVTLVLPAYNEAERIGPALDELFGYLLKAGSAREGGRSALEMGGVDVLVVDDGSTDSTADIVTSRQEANGGAHARLALLKRPHAGKGAAVQAGMLHAQGDYIIFADADLATPADQLPLLTDALRDHDIALGSRVQPDGTDRRASQPLHRRLLGRVFHALASFWVTGPVPDTQCGFKGFRRSAAHDLFARQQIHSIVFDAEVINLARKRGYSIATVPVQWSDKRGSRMRVRPSLALRVVYDLFRIPLIHRKVRRA
jgi:dolichyl-phosphate beta-glucosyltransferase